MFWVMPGLLTLAAALMVLISTRSRSQTAAQQLGGVLGILSAGMIGLQGVGMVRADVITAGWVGAGLWVAALAVVLWARRDFSRQRLVLRL
jgi:hypothetical protein